MLVWNGLFLKTKVMAEVWIPFFWLRLWILMAAVVHVGSVETTPRELENVRVLFDFRGWVGDF